MGNAISTPSPRVKKLTKVFVICQAIGWNLVHSIYAGQKTSNHLAGQNPPHSTEAILSIISIALAFLALAFLAIATEVGKYVLRRRGQHDVTEHEPDTPLTEVRSSDAVLEEDMTAAWTIRRTNRSISAPSASPSLTEVKSSDAVLEQLSVFEEDRAAACTIWKTK